MRGGSACMVLALGCCAPLDVADLPDPDAPFAPVYQPVETRLLDSDLVEFSLSMQGARTEADVTAYADCVAAGYTLIRGYEFARHLRTKLDRRGGVWRADAVYTISPQRPAGTIVIDARETVANCKRVGIPTV